MTEQHHTLTEKEKRERAHREAAAWLLKFEDGKADESDGDYIEWLTATSEHAEAMARVQGAWNVFGDHATAPEVVRARSLALNRSGKTAARRWGVFGAIPDSMKLIAAATLIAVMAIPTTFYLIDDHNGPDSTQAAALIPDLYETEIGETRIVTLQDNTRVSLDASTTLSVLYTNVARDIALEQGQAHFDVAKDYRRPFRVTVGDQTIVATGTAFNVELVGDEVLVTLLEGEVVVTDAVGADRSLISATRSGDARPRVPAPVKLQPGQQLVASAEAPPRIETEINVEKTNAWRDGKVFLEGDSLEAAVERMNRYSRIRISVANGGLEELRISGVFDAGDTDAFVEAVEAYFPIEARRMTASQIELHPRS